MLSHFARPSTPAASRGILPLIAAAYGAAKAGYGIYEANQRKQRNKGYIGAAYRSASLKMDNHQKDVTQSTEESLVARGLGGASGSAVRAAMVGGVPVSQGPAPTTLAGQTETDLGKEFSSERSDLENAKTQALNENKADYLNSVVGSVANGVQSAASAYSTGQDLAALKNGPSMPAGYDQSNVGNAGFNAAAPSATRTAYMSGIDDPSNSWGGIHPVDPLNAPGSSWNPGGPPATTVGDGQANYGFNFGGG